MANDSAKVLEPIFSNQDQTKSIWSGISALLHTDSATSSSRGGSSSARELNVLANKVEKPFWETGSRAYEADLASAHVRQYLGQAELVDAGDAETPGAIVDKVIDHISRFPGPVGDVVVTFHGSPNASYSLHQKQYNLTWPSAHKAFARLKPYMEPGSRLILKGCNIADGERGGKNLQVFADGLGMPVRAYTWKQLGGTKLEGFGPYVEAVPKREEQTTGFQWW